MPSSPSRPRTSPASRSAARSPRPTMSRRCRARCARRWRRSCPPTCCRRAGERLDGASQERQRQDRPRLPCEITSPPSEAASGDRRSPVLGDRFEEIFRELLAIEPPPADTDLIAAGLLDSLMLITLLAELEVMLLDQHPARGARSRGDPDAGAARRVGAAAVARPSGPRPPIAPMSCSSCSARAAASRPCSWCRTSRGAPLALRPLAFALETTRPIYALAPPPPERRPEPLRVESLADTYVAGDPVDRRPDRGACSAASRSAGWSPMRRRGALRPRGRAGGTVDPARYAPRRSQPGHPRRYWGFRLVQPLRAVFDVLPDLRARVPDVVRRTLRERRAGRALGPGSASPPDRAAPGARSQWTALAHDGRPGVSSRALRRRHDAVCHASPAVEHVQAGDRVVARDRWRAARVERIPGTHLNFLRGEWLDGMATRAESA